MSLTLESALAARALAAGVQFTPLEASRLAIYYTALERWNSKINLTALPLTDYPSATLDRLIMEPAVAARFVPADTVLRLLDIGSGGGSPAIPLRILRPRLALTMTESRQKKGAFLREAVATIGLTGVAYRDGRLEDQSWTGEFYDWISIRAVRIDASVASVLEQVLPVHGNVLFFGSVDDAPELPFLRRADQSSLPGGSTVILMTRAI